MVTFKETVKKQLHSSGTIQKKRFYRQLRRRLVVCQIFGTAPILEDNCGSNDVSTARRLHHLWCLTILIYLYSLKYDQMGNIDPKLVMFEKALYLSEFLANSAIVTLVISSSYYYADYYRSVPSQLLKLFSESQRYATGTRSQSSERLLHKLELELYYFTWIAAIFMILCFVTDFVLWRGDFLASLRSSSAYIVPNILITLSLSQYWLALRFFCLLYRRFNDILRERLSRQPKSAAVIGVGGPHFKAASFRVDCSPEKPVAWAVAKTWYKREFLTYKVAESSEDSDFLENVRAVYAELDSLMEKFISAFGFRLLLNIFVSFVDMVTEYFAIYKFFDRPNVDQLAHITYKFLWVILHTGRIFFIFVTNTTIINAKCQTSLILNDAVITSKHMEHTINRFLLQLMVRKQAESACGIVELDLLFLGGISNALAMYIIFLIQIDLGNESLVAQAQNRTTATATST